MRNPEFSLKATGLILLALVAMPTLAQVQTFVHPRYQGFDVNYCGADNASCGERVATEWCRLNGYQYATDWAAGLVVEAGSRSVRMDDGAICVGAACESFAHITCGRDSRTGIAMVPGPAERSTILSPNRRSTEASLGVAEFRVLIPGCSQREPGVFMCESILEYSHCRTLMQSRMVYSCRAALSFDGTMAEAHAASADSYSLDVNSDAELRVERGERGRGQIRGDARIELVMDPPIDPEKAWCLQRDLYLYYPTGPHGGMSDIGEPTDCDEPMEFSFAPHEDDLLRGYDLCDSFAAWGTEIEDSIDMLVAGLFHVRSNSPNFSPESDDGSAVIAPFLRVSAPVSIDCRQ
jgi:hypothetical protein